MSYKNGCHISTTYIHTYMRTHIHIYIHTYVLTYVHTYIHKYIRTYINTYIHTHIRTYIHIYIATYIHKYIHTNTQALTHTHTHTLSTVHKCVIKRAGYGTIRQYTNKQIYNTKYSKHFTNKTNLDGLHESNNGNIVRVGKVVTPQTLIVTNSIF